MFSFKRKSPSRVQNVSKRPKSRTTLDKLPELCLLCIFGALPGEDLLQIGQILPHWESLIPVVGKRKSSLRITMPLRESSGEYSGDPAEQNLSYSEIFPNLKALSITFKHDNFVDSTKILKISIENVEKWILSTLSSKLVSLKLTYWKGEDPSRHRCRISGCSIIRLPVNSVPQECLQTCSRLIKAISQLSSLKSLTLSGLSLDGFTGFSRLKHLTHFAYIPMEYSYHGCLVELVTKLESANQNNDDGLQKLETVTLDFHLDHSQTLPDCWKDLNFFIQIYYLPENIARKFTKLYFLSSLSTDELRLICRKFTSLSAVSLLFPSGATSLNTVLERLKCLEPLQSLKELELVIPEYSEVNIQESQWLVPLRQNAHRDNRRWDNLRQNNLRRDNLRRDNRKRDNRRRDNRQRNTQQQDNPEQARNILEQAKNSIVPLPSVTKLTIRLLNKKQLDSLIEPQLFPRLCPNVLQLTLHYKGEINYTNPIEPKDKKVPFKSCNYGFFETEIDVEKLEREKAYQLEQAQLNQRKEIFWNFVKNFVQSCSRLQQIDLHVRETFKTGVSYIPEWWCNHSIDLYLKPPFRENVVTSKIREVPKKTMPKAYRILYDIPDSPERDTQGTSEQGRYTDSYSEGSSITSSSKSSSTSSSSSSSSSSSPIWSRNPGLKRRRILISSSSDSSSSSSDTDTP